jgi:hypothetical protein
VRLVRERERERKRERERERGKYTPHKSTQNIAPPHKNNLNNTVTD